jgi:hypothetical protein
MTSEPCRHERAAGEAIRDALASLAASDAAMEIATTELLAKDATIGLLDEDVADWASRAVEAEEAIERVRALLGDTNGPLWSARGVREADIRSALEANP